MLQKFQPNLTKFGLTLYQKLFLNLYGDLISGLGMKNYLKMTPHMPHSAHRFQRYGKVFFHVS